MRISYWISDVFSSYLARWAETGPVQASNGLDPSSSPLPLLPLWGPSVISQRGGWCQLFFGRSGCKAALLESQACPHCVRCSCFSACCFPRRLLHSPRLCPGRQIGRAPCRERVCQYV